MVRAWFDNNSDFERMLAKLADSVNKESRDAPQPLCPSLAALETMPDQHALSAVLFSRRKDALLADGRLSNEDSAWFLSCCQFNAGSWLNSIPSLGCFQVGSIEFRTMLRIRLGLKLACAERVTCCKCEAPVAPSFKNGRHWMTVCRNSHRTLLHNGTRDLIAKMYRSLGVAADTEVKGLYLQLTSHGEYKPADVLVPASATEDGKAWALDVAYVDPTCPTYLARRSHKKALEAAKKRHEEKMSTHRKQAGEAGVLGLAFVKKPLVIEATGGMGKETQKWWDTVLALERLRRQPGDPTSRRDLGLEHTWSANKHSTFWLQSISMQYARAQASSVLTLVAKNST